MLRDKFIHYFQQWSERQLSRGEHWLTQHLAGRSPREKGMLLAAAVFLFSAGYYCGAKIRHDNASTGIAGHQRQRFRAFCGH